MQRNYVVDGLAALVEEAEDVADRRQVLQERDASFAHLKTSTSKKKDQLDLQEGLVQDASESGKLKVKSASCESVSDERQKQRKQEDSHQGAAAFAVAQHLNDVDTAGRLPDEQRKQQSKDQVPASS